MNKICFETTKSKKFLFKKTLSLLIIFCLFIYPQNLKADTDITSDTTVTTLAAGGYNITSGNTLTANISSGTTTYSDVIRGAGSLAKSGNGTLTLTGTNTFTGNFKVTGGTVNINDKIGETAIVQFDNPSQSYVYFNNSSGNTIGGAHDLNYMSFNSELNAGSSGSDFTINVASGSSYVLSTTSLVGDTYSSTDELIKSGSGSQTLASISGFDGVKVNAGTLTLLGHSTNSGNTTVASFAVSLMKISWTTNNSREFIASTT